MAIKLQTLARLRPLAADAGPVSAISEGDGKYEIDADTASSAALALTRARFPLRSRHNR